jgi:hypothetical protein
LPNRFFAGDSGGRAAVRSLALPLRCHEPHSDAERAPVGHSGHLSEVTSCPPGAAPAVLGRTQDVSTDSPNGNLRLHPLTVRVRRCRRRGDPGTSSSRPRPSCWVGHASESTTPRSARAGGLVDTSRRAAMLYVVRFKQATVRSCGRSEVVSMRPLRQPFGHAHGNVLSSPAIRAALARGRVGRCRLAQVQREVAGDDRRRSTDSITSGASSWCHQPGRGLRADEAQLHKPPTKVVGFSTPPLSHLRVQRLRRGLESGPPRGKVKRHPARRCLTPAVSLPVLPHRFVVAKSHSGRPIALHDAARDGCPDMPVSRKCSTLVVCTVFMGGLAGCGCA